MSLELTSDAFTNGQSIPAKYSCVGKNISPALAWNEPPAGTQSFALIVDDPDAPMGTWVHWVLFNIPARHAQPAGRPADHRKECRPERDLCRQKLIGQYSAMMVPVRRAAHIAITSNYMRWIQPLVFCLAPPRNKY